MFKSEYLFCHNLKLKNLFSFNKEAINSNHQLSDFNNMPYADIARPIKLIIANYPMIWPLAIPWQFLLKKKKRKFICWKQLQLMNKTAIYNILTLQSDKQMKWQGSNNCIYINTMLICILWLHEDRWFLSLSIDSNITCYSIISLYKELVPKMIVSNIWSALNIYSWTIKNDNCSERKYVTTKVCLCYLIFTKAIFLSDDFYTHKFWHTRTLSSLSKCWNLR